MYDKLFLILLLLCVCLDENTYIFQIEFITSADTFMIGTCNPDSARGADCSHRGGRPGFVRVVDRKKLVWGVSNLSIHLFM